MPYSGGMPSIKPLLVVLLGVASIPDLHAQERTIAHRLEVTLQPTQNSLTVSDHVTLPAKWPGDLRFSLHAGLAPSCTDPGVRLTLIQQTKSAVPLETYRVELPKGALSFTLRYAGKIHHSLKNQGQEYARSFRQTPGLIATRGTYLSAATYWFPRFGDELLTFRLDVRLPATLNVVSQGQRTRQTTRSGERHVRWEETRPQDDIYLIAGAFHEYTRQAGAVLAMAFLRRADPALAQRYLEATAQYIEMYRQLIGPYPYRKFALVENFWETGYGMPSFTLLGPRVIRLPFILHSSYPHEILHNWWGNGVFVDYQTGNWCEGLTAYLADHLIKEQRGQAAAYRRTALQGYADYAANGKDFPLSKFRSRHSASTQAVGYGKCLMLFHMLRLRLGDARFVQGLRQFYRTQNARRASFDDLRAAFSEVAGSNLKAEFAQWVDRAGAPQLRVCEATVRQSGKRFVLTARIDQLQQGPAYQLRVPLAVWIEGQQHPLETTLSMTGKSLPVSLTFDARPVKLLLDPRFDLFRKLDRREIPPALSLAFGATRAVIVLPSAAPEPLREAYRQLAQTWVSSQSGGIQIVSDADLTQLPADKTVWLLGWKNRFRDQIHPTLRKHGVRFDADTMRLGDVTARRAEHATVVVGRHPGDDSLALAWIGADNARAIPGLTRKLPHYGKYSYLAFSGDAPTNVAKGQWDVIDAPTSISFEGKRTGAGRLDPRKPLATLPPAFDAARMGRDVRYLASAKLAGRGFGTRGLDAAASYIAQEFRKAGLRPGGAAGYFQSWAATSGKLKGQLKNVIAVLPGSRPEWKRRIVILSAHYDHLGTDKTGRFHPGADDNASGVAVMLELARLWGKGWRPENTVLLVAFSGEELGLLGSRHFVKQLSASCLGAINLDSVGRLGQRKLMVLGSGTATEWVHIFRGIGWVTGIETQLVAKDPGGSDQVAFHEARIPAVQLFSGAHPDYHRPGDTADKIDLAGLVKTATVVRQAVEYLAARARPLTSTLSTAGKRSTAPRPSGGRRVSLGTIPDFAHRGKGVGLSGVVPGSPAAKAGLASGDVLVALDGKPTDSLRAYAQLIRTLKPGQAVVLSYRRKGKLARVTLITAAR